ncbi:hypothetical protein [uncultured Ruminococcus sp.]|uniref:RNA polymerase sigma factor n=1 Tax=uncultured Ruminococcus sp. TaxID=165186 RepID=UPI0025E3EC94|nr:hypothetical protein [uncultured Ruminococcus sp.]
MTLETLKQCRSASLARTAVKRRIAELREDATGISGIRYDGDMPHTRGEPLSRQQRYVEALEQLSAEYEETTTVWAERAAEIERAVRFLPPKLGELVRLRYIDGLKWEQVNEQLCISEATSKRMHREVMQNLKNDLV